MDIDKFGLNIFNRKKTNVTPITLPWCHLKVSGSEKCLDVQHKTIKNLMTPVDSFDACTKEYVDSQLADSVGRYSSLNERNEWVIAIKERLTQLEKKIELVKTKHEQKGRGK